VAEVSVVGIPDDTFGENICAAIVLKPGCTASPEELREHAARWITRFKLPVANCVCGYAAESPVGKNPEARDPQTARHWFVLKTSVDGYEKIKSMHSRAEEMLIKLVRIAVGICVILLGKEFMEAGISKYALQGAPVTADQKCTGSW